MMFISDSGKKTILIILVILLALLCIGMTGVTCVHNEHTCHDDNCSICLIIHLFNSFVKYALVIVFFSCPVRLVTLNLLNSVPILSGLMSKTPLEQKVKLII